MFCKWTNVFVSPTNVVCYSSRKSKCLIYIFDCISIHWVYRKSIRQSFVQIILMHVVFNMNFTFFSMSVWYECVYNVVVFCICFCFEKVNKKKERNVDRNIVPFMIPLSGSLWCLYVYGGIILLLIFMCECFRASLCHLCVWHASDFLYDSIEFSRRSRERERKNTSMPHLIHNLKIIWTQRHNTKKARENQRIA